MLTSLQPSRPKVQPPHRPDPLFQQQIRTSHTQAEDKVPRNQIEAMPPNTSSPGTAAGPALTLYNPALVHPVFFSESWRKPPFPLPINASFNPVAAGYVFGNGRPRSDSMTKL
ncbi:hypothetical protein LTR17_024656 [Elasticomyces elasticus]|nr:hypothetical protein LTR17_024656 [Elasticomyces elasticus]